MNTNTNIFEVLPWSKSFETGNSKIDEQHQVLVTLLNKLAGTLVTQDEVKLNLAFDALTDYVNIHFSDEEEIWLEYFKDDSWFSSHQKTHASFLPAVTAIKKQADSESLPNTIEKLVHFLLRWLILHIIDTDKRMVLAIDALESGATIDEAKVIADNKMNDSKLILIDTILNMYEELSSRTINLMREMNARKEAEKQLEMLTITDPLTGLFNRRHFDCTFETEMRKAIRDKTTLSFLLIDIDFFKGINDHYGHVAGDHALEQLGACLFELCRRPGDMAFRIGGEEFGILTTNESEKDTYQFAEMIRVAVENLEIPNNRSEVSRYMTVSIGVISKIPSVDDNLEKLIGVADKRLYRAKTLGRNQVVTSHSI